MSVFTPGISPYAYAYNNPISLTDEFGLGPFKDWLNKVKLKVADTFMRIFGYKPKGGDHNREYVKYHRNTYKPVRVPATQPPTDDNDRPPSDIDQISSIGFNGFENNTDVPDIEQIFNNPTPFYNVTPIHVDEEIKFSLDIKFGGNRFNVYEINTNEKTLSELVKTLIDYPQLQLEIIGNAATDGVRSGFLYGSSPDALNQRNKKTGMKTGTLMINRAKAVYNYLIDKGIDPSRLNCKTGRHSSNGIEGRKTTFNLKN